MHLTSQWAQLFQRLMMEGRTKTQEERRYRDFSERIEDLKAIVLTSLATPDLRETAKGAIQFRHLISFVSGLHFVDHRQLLLSNLSWDDLLKSARIKEIRSGDEDERMFRPEVYLVLDDGTFYRGRLPRRAFEDFRIDWKSFQQFEIHAREAIVDALLEDREARRFGLLRYTEKNINEYLSERVTSVQLEIGEQS